jgi:hypothetical protein
MSGCERSEPEGRPRPDAPTYPEVSERLRLREQRAAHTADLVARWRAAHPWATCGDATAALLADLWVRFGMASRGGPRSEKTRTA